MLLPVNITSKNLKTALAFSCRKYHRKNISCLFSEAKVRTIVVIQDCNIGGIFWRYFWQEDNQLFVYTGKPLIDCACISHIKDNCVYLLEGVEFLSHKVDKFRFEFHKK